MDQNSNGLFPASVENSLVSLYLSGLLSGKICLSIDFSGHILEEVGRKFSWGLFYFDNTFLINAGLGNYVNDFVTQALISMALYSF